MAVSSLEVAAITKMNLSTIRSGLTLPLAATLGFVEVLILMFVFVWLAARRQRKHSMAVSAA